MRFEEIVEKALRIVKPNKLEERRFRRIVDEALKAARELVEKAPGVVDVTLEGSAAKNTWVRGRAEADIFIHFDPETSREELEKRIVELGTELIESLGGEPMLMYADHPYVEGVVDGVTIDVVACYRVEPRKWIGATDRTPYHTRYVVEKLKPGQEDEVRLLKGFMIGCGVYGAEIKVRGFSGYLTELLTIRYGSFLDTIRAAASWKPPIVIDLEGYYESVEDVLELFRDSPLIVIDPVDRSRNVAAAVSHRRLSEFILASKLFLKRPSLRFFRRVPGRPRASSILKLAKNRNILYVYFKLRERKPRDVIWGELKRSEEGIAKALERLRFKVYRREAWTDEDKRCLLIFELDKLNLPSYMLHQGPPIHLRNAEDFLEKWIGRGVGPWVDDGRLYVLRKVGETSAIKLLAREIREGRVSISRDLASYFGKALIDSDLRRLFKRAGRDVKLLGFLQEFLKAKPPFLQR